MKNKVNIPDALKALDLAHSDLFEKLDKAKSTGHSIVVARVELECLFILVANAMVDLGDSRIKRSV